MNQVTDTEKEEIREDSIYKSKDDDTNFGIYAVNKIQGEPTLLNNSYYQCWRHNFERINIY